jgi:hypothetical protein
MANYIIHPTSHVSITGLTHNAASYTAAVNKGPSTFDDSTYIYTTLYYYPGTASYYFDVPSASGAISEVKIYYRISDTLSFGNCNVGAIISGTTYMKTAHGMDTSFTNRNQSFALNPYTGVNWVWTDFSSIQFIISLTSYEMSPARCSAFWIDIVYTSTTTYFLRKLAKVKQIP